MYEPLAFGTDERRDDVAIFTSGWFAVLLDVLLTFSANRRRAALAANEKKQSECVSNWYKLSSCCIS